jgi:RimJ/RimL family protein N-acetyltransferase
VHTVSLPLHTQRLILRRFTLGDVQDLLEFVSHPSVARVVPELEPTESGVRRYIERQLACAPFERDKVFDLAIARKVDGKVAGLLTLIRKEGRLGAIGWALGVEFRGQGYAAEAARALLDYAFSSLGLDRIEAETACHNQPSWKLMERLGMRRVALLQEGTCEEGKRLDSYVYAILADEWAGANSLDSARLRQSAKETDP